jgi:hypothetical protein
MAYFFFFAVVCLVPFASAALPNEVQLENGATSTPDGFYIHLSLATVQPEAMAREHLNWLKLKIPHQVGKNAVGNCIIRLTSAQAEPLAILRVTPYKTDKAHKEDAFDIIAVSEVAERMELSIEYMGVAEWGGRIIAKQYKLKLRDYLPPTK